IEGGARAGMIAPDDTTFAWLEGRPHSPQGKLWEQALDDWRSLVTDEGAEFDREIHVDASALRPAVTWGTNPAQSVTIDDAVPDPPAHTPQPPPHPRPNDHPPAAAGRRARAHLHEPHPGHGDPRHHRGRGVHRLVHQRAARGPARGRRGGPRPEGQPRRPGP